MATVKIYEIFDDDPYPGEPQQYYSLNPWGIDTVYKQEENNDGVDYLLPDSHSVGLGGDGFLYIFDSKDRNVGLENHEGHPAVVDLENGEMIILKKAENSI